MMKKGDSTPPSVKIEKEESEMFPFSHVTKDESVGETSGEELTDTDVQYKPEMCDHYEFFLLCNIKINEQDVKSLNDNGFDMKEIFFNVQFGTKEDIETIKKCLITPLKLAQECRFRNMIQIMREYINRFTSGYISNKITMKDLVEWNTLEKNVEEMSTPRSTTSENKLRVNSISEKEAITNLVNRQCQVVRDQRIRPLPKIREQRYQVEWEEDVRLVMGENNMSYLLDSKVLYDDFSECNIDENIIQIQDSRFWYDLKRAVLNSDVEHTLAPFENHWKNGQNRASGRKAWLAITTYRNTSEQNTLSFKMSKKVMEDMRYDASKTQLGHFLNEFELNFKRFKILGRRVRSYWSEAYEANVKLELFTQTIVYSSLDQMSKQIIFNESRDPTLDYDELVKELRQAQSTLEILESISPKSSSVRRTNNGNQNSSSNNNNNKNTTNSQVLSSPSTEYKLDNNTYKTNGKGYLTWKQITQILGEDIANKITQKQVSDLAKKFKNSVGTFHEYVAEIRKISKQFMKDNRDQNIDFAAENERFKAERAARKKAWHERQNKNKSSNNDNNSSNNDTSTVRRQIFINEDNSQKHTKMIKDSVENVIIGQNAAISPPKDDKSKESENKDFRSLRRYQNNQAIIVLDSGAQNSCNGTIGPLITYRGNEYSNVVGPSSDMIGRRINNTTSYIKLMTTNGSPVLGNYTICMVSPKTIHM